jgi:3-hydroxyacyl-CoA dehydrogenase
VNASTSSVRFERRDNGIAVVTIDRPPVNALGETARRELLRAIEACRQDPAVRAVVLTGAGRGFFAGADIREFGQPRQPPTLRDIIETLENLDRPVVAALHGTVLGGGLELALGCHYRTALPGTTFGLPEIRLGLIPGAGGTQRLPRLVSVPVAGAMILSGEPADTARARAIGLIDDIGQDDPIVAGIAFAEQLLARHAAPRRTASLSASATHDSISDPQGWRAVRARPFTGEFAAARAIQCVDAAATLPYEQGAAFERAQFEECRVSPESAALRYVFFAEREASRLPDVSDQMPGRPIARAGVVGAGAMGSGIAIALASAGIETLLVDTDDPAVERGLAVVRRHFEDLARRGRLDAQTAAQRIAAVRGATSLSRLADADLVIEAVFEEIGLKRRVFSELDRTCRADAVLATNTSTLDVDAIAAATVRPQDVVGLHFFSPAHVMKLLEIVRGARTGSDVLATARDLARRLGKIGVVTGVCFGFIGNRMLQGYFREAFLMLLEGASPTQLDAALTRFGMAMGPCAVRDLTGIDVGLAIRAERARLGLLPPDPRPWAVLEALSRAGRLGQKKGAGLYRYLPGDRRPQPDPEVDALLAQEARRLGITRRDVPQSEIVERCLLALVTEGVRIIEEGIAMRASDIDVVWVHGYGFPRYCGGPIYWAQQRGLASVAEGVATLATRLGNDYGYWDTPPLLARLARERGNLLEGSSPRSAEPAGPS